MPFSKTTEFHTQDYWDTHFESFLKPLIDSCKEVEAFRSVPLRQDIFRPIINDLVFSPVVVADLTDSNSNVYWELGVRLSFRQGTVTIAEECSDIPFDIKTKGVLFYPSDPNQRDNFSRQFKKAINDCISHPNRPDSVVLETVTGRSSIYAIIHHQELIQRVNGLIAENEMNNSLFSMIIKQAVENKGKKLTFIRGNKKSVMTRLSYTAMDMLLAERFLEEDNEFYAFVHAARAFIQGVNHELSNWDYNTSKQVEKWFLENNFIFKELIQQYNKKLVDIKQKLILIC